MTIRINVYQQLNKITGVSIPSLRMKVSRGEFDPESLESVCEWLNAQQAAVPEYRVTAGTLPADTKPKGEDDIRDRMPRNLD